MYSNQDKKDFILKDVKYAIGAGVGNAFSKAIDILIANGHLQGEGDVVKIVSQIEELRDELFESNQEAVSQAYAKWLKENEDGLDMTLGLGVKENPEPL